MTEFHLLTEKSLSVIFPAIESYTLNFREHRKIEVDRYGGDVEGLGENVQNRSLSFVGGRYLFHGLLGGKRRLGWNRARRRNDRSCGFDGIRDFHGDLLLKM